MARATRSKKDVCGGRERKRTRVARGRLNEEEDEEEGRVRGWRWVGEGIQLIVGKLLTSDWNAP